MPDRVFIDSNILIYVYSADEPIKQQRAEKLLMAHDTVFISTQTINEFVSVLLKKKMLSTPQVVLAINEFFKIFVIETIDQITIQKAIELVIKYRYSYFDSLMLASALMSNCSILYSEDMHHAHLIEKSLKIINPFSL